MKQVSWACHLVKRIDIVSVKIVLYYRYRAGYKKFLIDLTTDFCAYHDNQAGSAILDLVGGMFKNYTTNLWHPCPYHPNYYSLTNLPLTSPLVKHIFLPAGEYKLVINTLVGDKNMTSLSSLTTVVIFFHVPAGRTLENDNMG